MKFKFLILSILIFAHSSICKDYYHVWNDSDNALRANRHEEWLEASAQYKSRRIVKGDVFNPEPVAEMSIKVRRLGFYSKLNVIEDLTGYNSSRKK